MRTPLKIFENTSYYQNSELVLLAVPWSVTASFGTGQEKGPKMLSQASSQMDYFSLRHKDNHPKKNICFLSAPEFINSLNTQIQKLTAPIIKLESAAPEGVSKTLLDQINESCSQVVNWVYEETKKIHTDNKHFGLVGGDHSSSEGAIKYFSTIYPNDLGILHIDAHADLRNTYQGFVHSHASIMYNVMNLPTPPTLVQVGIRDYCKEEYVFIKQNPKIHTFFDTTMNTQLFEGQNWKSIVDSIIKCLPQKVYISLDVDGLQAYLFPNTGTPVPGGLSFEKISYLLNRLFLSGREVIGFDFVEVAAPDTSINIWDAKVGARLLYLLCHLQ